jgi:hypothetical protein
VIHDFSGTDDRFLSSVLSGGRRRKTIVRLTKNHTAPIATKPSSATTADKFPKVAQTFSVYFSSNDQITLAEPQPSDVHAALKTIPPGRPEPPPQRPLATAPESAQRSACS